MSVLVMFAQVT